MYTTVDLHPLIPHLLAQYPFMALNFVTAESLPVYIRQINLPVASHWQSLSKETSKWCRTKIGYRGVDEITSGSFDYLFFRVINQA